MRLTKQEITERMGWTEERAETYLMGYDTGREHGAISAQRFFRLALGIEAPTQVEAALWNNPVPLKDCAKRDVG